MILAGHKAEHFCSNPDKGIHVVLGFGEDSGVVSDAFSNLIKAWECQNNKPLARIRIAEEDVRKDPALLAEHLTAVSLLGDMQVIQVGLSNEHLAKHLSDLVMDIQMQIITPENYLQISAGGLTKKSKIREAFANSKAVTGLHFYADSQARTHEMIKRELVDAGLQIEADALEVFASELPGDRHMANSEIEKLKLYAMDLGRPLAVSDIESLAASEQPKGADDAADAALSGHVAQANVAIDRFLDAGGSAVSALRTLHFRLLRVIDAKSGASFLRPPVFENERSAFNKMLQEWTTTRITRALATLYAAEKTCKQGGAPAEAALKIVIDRISRRLI